MAFGILHYLDHSVESCVAGSFFIDWCISKATSVLRGEDQRWLNMLFVNVIEANSDLHLKPSLVLI